MKKETKKFKGFLYKLEPGDFWQYPSIMDNYWKDLSGSEHKILDFILRRTYGFDKREDRISYSQFEKGVGKIDKGPGPTRPTIIKAINGLIEKGFIKKTRNKKINNYALIVKDFNQISKDNLPIASKDNLHTINNITINNITKEDIFSYKFRKRKDIKPFYMGEEMRWSQGQWWVIPNDGGEWLEFADKENKIEWRKKQVRQYLY